MRIAHLVTAFLLSGSWSAFAATEPTPVAPASQSATQATATLLPENHPILGVWKWVTPHSDCSETYTFKSNGQMVFSSGAEDGISEIVVAEKPSLNGFYRFTNKVIADNGKNDCRGEPGKVGVNSVIYVYFLPTSNQMKMCYKETSDSCFGPLTRQ